MKIEEQENRKRKTEKFRHSPLPHVLSPRVLPSTFLKIPLLVSFIIVRRSRNHYHFHYQKCSPFADLASPGGIIIKNIYRSKTFTVSMQKRKIGKENQKDETKSERLSEYQNRKQNGKERERETYLQEVERTFFFRRLRGCNRESRGERKRKSGGERKKESRGERKRESQGESVTNVTYHYYQCNLSYHYHSNA